MATLITDGFDQGDDEKVVSILKKWKGGVLSDILFTKLAKILPQVCVETVILRKNNRKIEVLLVSRPDGDPVWPKMIHSPGGQIRAVDFHRKDKKVVNGVFERVQKNEIRTNFILEPVFVENIERTTKRGSEVAIVYFTQIEEDSGLSKEIIWCDVEKLENLPNMMKDQIEMIRNVAKFYLASSNHLPSL